MSYRFFHEKYNEKGKLAGVEYPNEVSALAAAKENGGKALVYWVSDEKHLFLIRSVKPE